MPSFAVGSQPLLGPAIGLCGWTLAMEAWMYALRLPAMSKYKVDASPEMTKESLNAKLPASVKWPADNYNHLMEQPTQFFATVLALNQMGVSDAATVRLAWIYVGLRVAHSLVQGFTNIIMIRFALFSSSSLVLGGLTWKAASIFFGLGGGRVEL